MSERSERLFQVLSEIDGQKIDESAPVSRPKGIHWKRWAALAAAAALAVGVGSYVLPRIGGSGGGPGANSAGADGASSFMSYAGPVLPLTLRETDSSITADREITLDFAPWVKVWRSNEDEANSRTWLTQEQRQDVLNDYNKWYPEGGRWESSTDIHVTDAYAITNTSQEDKTVPVLYPFASELWFAQKRQPVLTADGMPLDTVLWAGSHTGGFAGEEGEERIGWNQVRLNSWEGYKTLMEGGGYQYQQSAFEGWPDLSDIPVIVYAFTEPQGDGADAAAIRSAFALDYGKTQVLSWGFNGGDFDQEKGWMGMSFFIPTPHARDADIPRYLIVLGDDIGEMDIQGYANLGCEAGDERDFTVQVHRYETSLEEIAEEIARMEYGWWEEDPKADFEMYFGLMKENLSACVALSSNPEEWYWDGRLNDLEFAHVDRVFYLETEVTVPAGGSVRLEAAMTREASYDFYCAHTANQGIYSYDMLTRLGSNLTCTVQTAILEDHGQIEIVRQNFGFDLENGVHEVTLDTNQEHYYLEVREREVPTEK